MPKYRVLPGRNIGGYQPEGTVVEMTEEYAAGLVEDGCVELVVDEPAKKVEKPDYPEKKK